MVGNTNAIHHRGDAASQSLVPRSLHDFIACLRLCGLVTLIAVCARGVVWNVHWGHTCEVLM